MLLWSAWERAKKLEQIRTRMASDDDGRETENEPDCWRAIRLVT